MGFDFGFSGVDLPSFGLGAGLILTFFIIYLIYPRKVKYAFHQLFRDLPAYIGERGRKWKTKDEVRCSINKFRNDIAPDFLQNGVDIKWTTDEEFGKCVEDEIVLNLNYENRDKSYANAIHQYVSTELISEYRPLVSSQFPEITKSIDLSVSKDIIIYMGRSSVWDVFYSQYINQLDPDEGDVYKEVDEIRKKGFLYGIFLPEIRNIALFEDATEWRFEDSLHEMINFLYEVSTKLGDEDVLPEPLYRPSFATDFSSFHLILIGKKSGRKYSRAIDYVIKKSKRESRIYIMGAGKQAKKAEHCVRAFEQSRDIEADEFSFRFGEMEKTKCYCACFS